MNTLTLGSLFSGSGGFELAGMCCKIKPIWASEIEPFPILVTRKNIPQMKHLGDICKIDGSKIEPVDIITFGSPCQNMSIAGNRTGLNGNQSVLFYEAIRIIKEMRDATNEKYPRFAVWENVPGAFSSNRGEDFRSVLEAFIKIVEPKAKMPAPDKNKWAYSDVLLGNGWSVAYRTLDSQYFYTPQRRKRIYLVADFGSECAGKILFEPKGVPRNFIPFAATWQRVAENSKDCFGAMLAFEPGATSRLGGHTWNNSVGTLKASSGGHQFAVVIENPTNKSEPNAGINSNKSKYIVRRLTPLECCRLQNFPDFWCQNLEIENPTDEEIQEWDLVFKEFGKPKSKKQIKKWLQNPHSDLAQYKLWGNGISLPCAYFVLSGIQELYTSKIS